MGMLTGAIGGALFGAVGFTNIGGLAHSIGHATAGALSGGISSAIGGGDILQGALIGGFSAGASEFMGTNVPFLKDSAGGNFSDYLRNVTRRAVIGGTVGGTTSWATGGDFWDGAQQGAMTSAIAYTANDWMHRSNVVNGMRTLCQGVTKWFGKYYSKSYSYSFLMTGESYGSDGDIRDTTTLYDLGGFSCNFSFGEQPLPNDTTSEFGIGIGDYMGIGFEYWNDSSEPIQRGALNVHVGIGLGTPIYYSRTEASKTQSNPLPDPTYLYKER